MSESSRVITTVSVTQARADAVVTLTEERAPGGGGRHLPWGQSVQACLLLRRCPLGPGTERANCQYAGVAGLPRPLGGGFP